LSPNFQTVPLATNMKTPSTSLKVQDACLSTHARETSDRFSLDA
jgi:hypothetical protein